MWFRPIDRLQVGVAYLWKQGAFRGLANYEVLKETKQHPNLRAGFGLQGIATGNPGYFVTSEKNFTLTEGNFNAFVGVGWRTNEDHYHLLGGAKFTPAGSRLTLGIQLDGHNRHPFVTYGIDSRTTIGVYAIESKTLGIMLSVGF